MRLSPPGSAISHVLYNDTLAAPNNDTLAAPDKDTPRAPDKPTRAQLAENPLTGPAIAAGARGTYPGWLPFAAHPRARLLPRRQPCAAAPAADYATADVQVFSESVEEDSPLLPLSRTTERVLRILLDGDLFRLRAESVAESLGISCTTLRRRLRSDHTSYQFLLDRARQYRCESRLRERWLPGKCLADELGYLEVNSFYRAFRRWTGLSYSDYRQRYH